MTSLRQVPKAVTHGPITGDAAFSPSGTWSALATQTRSTVFAACAVLAGCGATDGSLEPWPDSAAAGPLAEQGLAEQDQDFAELGQGLSASIGEGPFDWDKSQPSQFMKPTSTHFCVLTRVKGDFRGVEQVKVFDQSDGSWMLGVAGAKAIEASAFCFRRTAFRGKSPTTFVWSGPKTEDIASEPEVKAWKGRAFAEPLFQGDAASMISGISGVFNGSGESVRITQATLPFDFNTLGVSSAISVNPGTRGYATSLFVGVPQSGYIPQFIGPNGTGDARTAGEFVLSAGQSVLMAPANQAMCYFTGLSGTLQSLSQGADITITRDSSGVERWRLRSNLFEVRARCYKFDQS